MVMAKNNPRTRTARRLLDCMVALVQGGCLDRRGTRAVRKVVVTNTE